jgi:Nif11 domain
MTTSSSNPTTDLEQFYNQYLKDPTLQEQLKTATTPENMCKLAVELGKEQGYRFTKEEAMAALESGGVRGSCDPSHVETPIVVYAK